MKAIARTILTLTASIALAAGCGGDEGSTEPKKQIKTGKDGVPVLPVVEPEAVTEISCLEQAKLKNAEKRDTNLWRGTDPTTGIMVRLERFPKPTAAANAVAAAKDVRAAVGGRYAAFGGVKASDDGARVAAVAACAATIDAA